MEDGYCCSCAEVIWNPLSFEEILSQVREYIKKNYPEFVLREWDRKMNEFLLRKHERFNTISLCPHCTVLWSKTFLETTTGKKDKNLESFLQCFTGI